MPRDLTPGEIRALRTYCEREYHEAAAQSLSISTQTLKNHLGAAYRKLDKKKAHSALYALCLQQGFDPFAASAGLHIAVNGDGSAGVNSESTTFTADIVGKYRESPAGDPILTQTAGDDTIPSELSSVIQDEPFEDSAVLSSTEMPPIIERDGE